MHSNLPHDNDSWFFWAPAIFGGLVAALLFFIPATAYPPIIGGLLVLSASLFIGWQLRRRYMRSIEHLLQPSVKSGDGNTSITDQILPVWARQIHSARQVGDEAVTELTSLFGGIVAKLETSMASSRKAATEVQVRGATSSNGNSQSDFQAVIAALKGALDSVKKNRGEHMTDQELSNISQAEIEIDNVLARFSLTTEQFDKSVSSMDRDFKLIRNDISSALVSLQFQDRVSQILSHVNDNLTALREHMIEDGATTIDADAWLAEMENGFTMEEEYVNLHASQEVPVTSSKVVPHDATTFF